MAHSLSAKKRVRQNIKLRARNRARKELIKVEMKAFTAATTAGDLKKADLQLRAVSSRLARTVAKGSLHKNTSARKRSRLQKRLNALGKQGSGAGTTAAKA